MQHPLYLYMRKFLLLFHTIKYLKWPQLYFRVYRKLVKPRVTQRLEGQIPERNSKWWHVWLYDEKITTQYKATFLNHTKRLKLPDDWNDESHSKLWVYNLHYFEDLLATGAEAKYDFHLELLNLWITQNSEGSGNGWEPYPTSLRISNVLKAWQGGLPLAEEHFISLYAQASFLSNDLEKHLLGNHYFVNLKALLFAGVILAEIIYLTVFKSSKSNISEIVKSSNNTEEIGNVLYTKYFIDFQLSGIVLLLAMIGAIVLTHVYRPSIKRQNIDKQNTTYSKDRIKLVETKSGEGINYNE